MSTSAIIMLVLAALIVWGGLAVSVVYLLKHPEGSVELLDDHGRPLNPPT